MLCCYRGLWILNNSFYLWKNDGSDLLLHFSLQSYFWSLQQFPVNLQIVESERAEVYM